MTDHDPQDRVAGDSGAKDPALVPTWSGIGAVARGGIEYPDPSSFNLPTQTYTVPMIYGAMLALMDRVRNVAKSGQMDAKAGGYKFRGIEDLIRDVGAAAREVGIMLQSRVVSSDYDTRQAGDRVWTSCRLVVAYSFTSLEDGSKVSFQAAGEGRDSADKATSKAMSMALKYALGQALLIGTDDPDPDGERPEVPAQERTVAAASAGTKVGRANEAFTAARAVKTRAMLGAIRTQARREDLLDVQLGGHTLASRLDAIEAGLPE